MSNEVDIESFFLHVKELAHWFKYWTEEYPKEIVINPDIIGKLSRVDGFYEREEVKTQVDQHTRMIRRFSLDFGTVLIIEDWEEKFLHFE